jgi:hypothetical protein
MKSKISCLHKALDFGSRVAWESRITHMIPLALSGEALFDGICMAAYFPISSDIVGTFSGL